ncbi:DUF3179 domain-containing protein [Thalassobaculum sp.]|uniref:DUF3179 domain-containing protein n=1 Tax=Thalassobaculum sp. TaxID=2022740 RepID=UPI0032EF42A5
MPHIRTAAFRVLALLLLLVTTVPARAAEPMTDAEVERLSEIALLRSGTPRLDALGRLAARGNPDVAATLVMALRYRRDVLNETAFAFQSVTGTDIATWYDAMVWQQAHPEVTAHPSYRTLKLTILERLDPGFLRFLGGDLSRPDNLDIRLEEITWGGVRVDGIPSLDRPAMIAAADADYLLDDDLVFGVAIDGDVRAYPLRIMGWHEMLNDVVGGVPVALAYCTLCGAGILFETQVDTRPEPLIFGSSGLLYRSNKLMFDRATDSLWNQFTGRPVSGPLRGTGVELRQRPIAIESWKAWRTRNPQTLVMSLETGHTRDYGSGVVYREYFASPALMFPALVEPGSPHQPKEYVFGIRVAGGAKAWPLDAFAGGAVINDAVGLETVVLIGDWETRTVRAYRRGDREFAKTDDPQTLIADGVPWTVSEEALSDPAGARLSRLPGHVSYWFAWDGYLGHR